MRKMYSLTDDAVKQKIQIMGRYEDLPDGISFDWTDSAVKIKALCFGDVTFNLRCEITCDKQTDKTIKIQYYSVFVDGAYREIKVEDVKDGQSITVNFHIDGDATEHEIWFVRQLERDYGSAALTSFSLDGELMELKPADTLIEFIGDSVTCAGASGKIHNENGTDSYAFLTAKALKADWRMVCSSGWGLKYDSCGLSDEKSCWVDSYKYENCFRGLTSLYKCRKKANIVCIYLGCNDYSSLRQGTSRFTAEDFAENGKKLIKTIKEYQPEARIAWLNGGISYAHKEAATLCIEELGGEKNGYYLIDLGGEYHGGSCWHPSAEEHIHMADALIDSLLAKKLV